MTPYIVHKHLYGKKLSPAVFKTLYPESHNCIDCSGLDDIPLSVYKKMVYITNDWTHLKVKFKTQDHYDAYLKMKHEIFDISDYMFQDDSDKPMYELRLIFMLTLRAPEIEYYIDKLMKMGATQIPGYDSRFLIRLTYDIPENGEILSEDITGLTVIKKQYSLEYNKVILNIDWNWDVF